MPLIVPCAAIAAEAPERPAIGDIDAVEAMSTPDGANLRPWKIASESWAARLARTNRRRALGQPGRRRQAETTGTADDDMEAIGRRRETAGNRAQRRGRSPFTTILPM